MSDSNSLCTCHCITCMKQRGGAGPVTNGPCRCDVHNPKQAAPQPYTPDELEGIRVAAPVNDKFGFIHVDYDRELEFEEKVTAAHAVVAGLEKSLEQAYTWFKESQAQVRDLEAQVQRCEALPTEEEIESAAICLVDDDGEYYRMPEEDKVATRALARYTLTRFLADRRSKPNEN